ncbi:UDP-glycosyltransferase 87A2-like isoform X2 [Gossypium australe]|uniref:UDP-glycosyltransferase 87A2-like isoform X2 n=1 Tax=Gossypium australe TaxID=47621 RepID=A0A5B6XC18_9ROSI|nr:UDP-glycosyltransferase 87A2-like isoform X2 [Gossypium australe]
MSSTSSAKRAVCHIVAMPYPGRGHINPLMNLCNELASKSDNILITFVLTEEWLSFIGSERKAGKIRFRCMPNVVPSELVRASDMIGFLEAVWTKMEAPFEQLLDELELPPTLIIADTHLFWAVSVGNRRNIPVASFWPMSTTMFSVFQHFHLLREKGHFPVDLLDNENEQVDYIPGVSSTRLLDLPGFNGGIYPLILKQILGCVSWAGKANYLLLPSIYVLESQTIDALKAELSLSIYTVGPSIPYLDLSHGDKGDCLQWLDRQPSNSVLYVSMGSFLSVSNVQMEEITAGLQDSGVRFLLVAREGSWKLKHGCGGEGLVVPWCDQLMVLCHPSIGGFWSHCGWNSVKEGIFAGTPFLTFPLFADQNLNSKLIVEDWKIGWRIKKHQFTTRGEISSLVKKLMDLESDDEVKQMRGRAKELQKECLQAIERHGSSESNINSFIHSILQFNDH